MTPTEWNGLSPAERVKFLGKVNDLRKDRLGLSNSEKRWDKLPLKVINAISEYSKRSTGDSRPKIVIGHDHKPKSEPFSVSVGKLTDLKVEEYSDPTWDGAVDLCISFDDTGSMHSVRSQVRQEAISLVRRLFETVGRLRVAIVIHNDYCDSPRHVFTMDFTKDQEKAIQFLNQSSPQGGGDAPECYELALFKAARFNWKASRRAMVLIGDELPHSVGYFDRSSGITNQIDWREEVKKLSGLGVNVYAVQALGRRQNSYFYEELAKKTNGVKLDLSQFQHISTYLQAIIHKNAGTLQDYQDSDSAFSTNVSLANMFNRLRGISGTLASGTIETLSRFQVMRVTHAMKIKDFVESNGCTYKRGRGFYQLVSRTADGKANFEIVQANKEVMFVDKATGETITDINWCREQLGVPYGREGTVRPLSIPHIMDKYDVYIQSNSFTRNLDSSTQFLYELDHR